MEKKADQMVEFAAPLWLNKNRKAFLQSRRIELLEKIAEHGSITKAAKAAGMSYKGAWDAVNSMNNLADKPLTVNVTGGRTGGGTFLTEEGRSLIQMFRMVEKEHGKALLNIGKNADDLDRALNLMRRISMRISAKNVCYGIIRDIKVENLLAEVCLELKSGHRIYSIITAESVDTLGLVEGEDVYAVIKASSVLISSDLGSVRISARNQLSGRIVSVRTDAVMGAVVLDIGGGDTISATVTAGGVGSLGVVEGDEACAIIEASNVIIGVE
ncbi:TOBE domain-containing protein [Geopsychrobacter electrodiphilus]|uniref:TOBE domain-containing protein n=1 Tax=Geopsychrobacter electrodiphilus TaxID=225196 RepID=UPI00036812B4|nr:TOBE domain-containing protein [Geopsychrobacter electrodiphilus]